MEAVGSKAFLLALSFFLVLLNGFYVAAEFALVKVRTSRLSELVAEGRPLAKTALWLARRLDQSLSACQLGITIASLGLGWIGEPAIARLLEPLLHAVGITSIALVHSISFTIAFSVITALHLVIGELAPKTFAIRQPERLALWCAVPLKWFYILSYPLLVALTTVTIALLKAMRIDGTTDHESAHSEEEIRWLLSHARTHGELTRSEHKLLNAVFEFDETICRQVMVPRVEVVFVDVDAPLGDAIRQARSSRHTRYPVCHGSLDKVLGVVHIKDLTGVSESDEIDLRKLMRPPRFVPETMPISRLLGHFQATRQHMAFVLDEYGTVLGIVTLENVIETIVGPVEDEFDLETPDVVPDGPGRFLVQGGTLLAVVNRKLGLTVFSHEVDTIAGLVMDRLGRIPQVGDTVDLDGATAEVLEVRGARATTLRLAVGTDDAGTGEGGRRPA